MVDTRQTDNTVSPVVAQDFWMSYDGHGRMKTRKYPIENTATETTWNYNLDDSINQIIDPRGARIYNSRSLMTYDTDDAAALSMQFDSRLRVSQHQVASSAAVGGYLKKAAFSYLADGRTSAMDNQVNDKFDRNFKYDFAQRLTQNEFGDVNSGDYPYQQTITYDAFSNMTQRSTTRWGTANTMTGTFTNGRKTNASDVTYDAAGNNTHSGFGNSGAGDGSDPVILVH